MRQLFLFIAFILFQGYSFGQDLEKDWQFTSIENSNNNALFEVNPNNDVLTFKEGSFQYSLEAKDNLKASGDYIFQNNLLVLFYNQPSDTIRRYRVSQLTDSTLVFSENNISYTFKSLPKEGLATTTEEDSDTADAIIPSQGFSVNSLWRGILGMISLLIIAFLFKIILFYNKFL